MVRKNYCLMFLLFFSLSAGVSAQITIKPVTVQKTIKLPTAQESGKIFAREKVRIVPLGQTEKSGIVNEALKNAGVTKTNSLTLAVKLSTTNPKSSADNFLMYFKPWNVLVAGDGVQFSEAVNWSDSSLAIAYKPPAPGYYLFDFSVKKIGETSFTFFTFDGKTNQSQKYPAGSDKYAHVTFVVNFTETNPQAVALLADKDWTFYDCEISQIK